MVALLPLGVTSAYALDMSIGQRVLVGIVAVVVVITGTFFTMKLGRRNAAKHEQIGSLGLSSKVESGFSVLKACPLFTFDDAKSLLGPDAVRTVSKTEEPAKKPFVVSECDYESADGKTMVRVVVQSAKNSEELDAAKMSARLMQRLAINSQNPIIGYGDTAYWDGRTGQLNFLKRTYWVAVSMGGADATANTREDAKKVADKVVTRL